MNRMGPAGDADGAVAELARELQVGAEPQLLDGRDPTGEAAYARLAHLLRPIRVVTHGALVNGVLGRDEMEAWLRRFDAQTQQPLGGRSSGGSHAR